MAKKWIEVADTCGALKFSGVPTREIHRRLTNDEAGLGYKLDVSLRRVYEYVADYERRHGPPPEPDRGDTTVESIQAVKDRIVALVAREVGHYEGKRKGKLTREDVGLLESFHLRLEKMERRELVAEKRLPLRKVTPGERPGKQQQPGRDETFTERLAREERERRDEDERQAEYQRVSPNAPEASAEPPQSAYEQRDEAT